MDREKDNQGQDNFTNFVLLKLQKLSAALYLITNPITDSDPIKWRLRDISLSVMSHINPEPITKILSLIDIVRLNPDVSQMNFDILKQEYLALGNMMDGQNKASLLARLEIAPYSPPARKTNQDLSTKPAGTDRRNNILKLIKQQGPTSVKDIAKSVPGVSSKTVQRELAELVRAGLLKKEGERRWSRYLAI